LLGLALGLLTASRATTTATAAYLPSAADLQQAQKVDDECMADDGSACALNALQLRGKSVETPLPLPTLVAPDFTLRRVGGVIDKEADDEDEDEDDEDEDEKEKEEEEDEEKEEDDDEAPTPPRRAAKQAGWVPGVDKIPVSGCYGVNGTKCPKHETCVVKYDGTYSQCVDCRKRSFGKECQKLDDYMRYAAVHTCKRTCEDSKCYNNHWCRKPHKCVIDFGANWGQCVNCRKKAKFWTAGCGHKSATFLEAAHKVCKRQCKVEE